jgi:hypothetical protein
MILLTVRKLIGDRYGNFARFGEEKIRSFRSMEKAEAWTESTDKSGVANWEKFHIALVEKEGERC